MIGLGVGARVMVATRSVDLRKAPDPLAALVGNEHFADAKSGVIYLIRAECSDRIQLG